MQVVKHKLQDGDKGIEQTIKSMMWRLAKRDATNDIVIKKANELRGATKEESAKNAFNYVVDNFQYRNDPEGVELVTAPIYMINGQRPYGDCDDLVTVLVCLLLALDVPCKIETIAWRLHDYTHVIANAKIDGKWIRLDPVEGKSGWGNTVPENKIQRTKKYSSGMGDFFGSRQSSVVSRQPVQKTVKSIDVSNGYFQII
jgi:hypothetical protein